MKKQIAFITTIAALLAGTALNAQSLATPKGNSRDFAVSVGLTTLFTSAKATADLRYEDFIDPTKNWSESESINLGSLVFFGPSFNFEWRIDQQNKLLLNTGFLFSNKARKTQFVYDDGMWRDEDKTEFSATAIPLLFAYGYQIPFGDNKEFEVSLTPTIGFIHFRGKTNYIFSETEIATGNTDVEVLSHKFNNTVFAYGIGVNFVWHINNRLSADIGYRFLATGKLKVFNSVEGDDDWRGTIEAKTKSLATHSLTAAIGFKF